LKKVIILFVLVLFVSLMGGTASGFVWTYEDFGPSVFDENNNTSPINYPGIGYLPSPGHYGETGEGFDDEGLFAAYRDNKLYGALTNSYGKEAYSSSWNVKVPTGDLFFGFNGAYDQFALDLETGGLYKVNEWMGILDIDASYYNNLTIRNAVGAYRMTRGDYLGTLTDFKMSYLPGHETSPLSPSTLSDTYVYEWCIDMSLLAPHMAAPMASATFHHTLACGNDLIEREVAIPEPATLILLGTGVLGLGIVRRRMKR